MLLEPCWSCISFLSQRFGQDWVHAESSAALISEEFQKVAKEYIHVIALTFDFFGYLSV
jgi:hypothetical protein